MQIETKEKPANHRLLAEGQVWKTAAADIEVVGLGKRLIHYRITRHLEPRQVSAQISGIEAMQHYLKTNQALLDIEPSRYPLKCSPRFARVQSKPEIVIGSRRNLMKVSAHECPGTTLSECATRAL
jgi:hypothetical protein